MLSNITGAAKMMTQSAHMHLFTHIFMYIVAYISCALTQNCTSVDFKGSEIFFLTIAIVKSCSNFIEFRVILKYSR